MSKFIRQMSDEELYEEFIKTFPDAATKYPNISIHRDKITDGRVWICSEGKRIAEIPYTHNEYSQTLFDDVTENQLAAINKGTYNTEKVKSMVDQLNSEYYDCEFTVEYADNGDPYIAMHDGDKVVYMKVDSDMTIDDMRSAADSYILENVGNTNVKKKRKSTGLDNKYVNELGVENADYYHYLFSKGVKRDFIVDVDIDSLSYFMEGLGTLKTIYGESKAFAGGSCLTDKLKTYYDGVGGDESINKEALSILNESNLLFSKVYQLSYLYQETDVKLSADELKYYLDDRDIEDVNMFFQYYAQGFNNSEIKTYQEYRELMLYMDEYSQNFDFTMDVAEAGATVELLDNCVRGAYFSYIESLSNGSEQQKEMAARLEKMWPQFSNAFGKTLYDRINNDPDVLSTTDSTGRYQNTIRLISNDVQASCIGDDGEIDYYQLALNTLAAQDYPMSYIFQPSISKTYKQQDGTSLKPITYTVDDSFIMSDLFIECMYGGLKAVDQEACDDFKWKVMEYRSPMTMAEGFSKDRGYEDYYMYDPTADPDVVYVDDDFYFLKASAFDRVVTRNHQLEDSLFGLTYYGDSLDASSRIYEYEEKDGTVSYGPDYTSELGEIYKNYYRRHEVDLSDIYTVEELEKLNELDSYYSYSYTNMEEAHALLNALKNTKTIEPDIMKRAYAATKYIGLSLDENDPYSCAAFTNYVKDYNTLINPFFDKYYNKESADYVDMPESLKKLGEKKFDEIVKNHAEYITRADPKEQKGSLLEGVWNTFVSFFAGVGKWADSVINSAITIGGYMSMYPDVITLLSGSRGKGAKYDAGCRMYEKAETMAYMVTAPKFNELVKRLYADTNSDWIDILTTVGENVGYYATSFLVGKAMCKSFSSDVTYHGFSKVKDLELPGMTKLGSTILKNMPGIMGAIGSQSNKICTKAINDLDEYGHIKKEYLYKIGLESGYAGVSYALQYCGTDVIGWKYDSKLAKYVTGYIVKAGIMPWVNEGAYAAIEGRAYNWRNAAADAGSAAIAQTVNIVMDEFSTVIKHFKESRGLSKTFKYQRDPLYNDPNLTDETRTRLEVKHHTDAYKQQQWQTRYEEIKAETTGSKYHGPEIYLHDPQYSSTEDQAILAQIVREYANTPTGWEATTGAIKHFFEEGAYKRIFQGLGDAAVNILDYGSDGSHKIVRRWVTELPKVVTKVAIKGN